MGNHEAFKSIQAICLVKLSVPNGVLLGFDIISCMGLWLGYYHVNLFTLNKNAYSDKKIHAQKQTLTGRIPVISPYPR